MGIFDCFEDDVNAMWYDDEDTPPPGTPERLPLMLVAANREVLTWCARAMEAKMVEFEEKALDELEIPTNHEKAPHISPRGRTYAIEVQQPELPLLAMHYKLERYYLPALLRLGEHSESLRLANALRKLLRLPDERQLFHELLHLGVQRPSREDLRLWDVRSPIRGHGATTHLEFLGPMMAAGRGAAPDPLLLELTANLAANLDMEEAEILRAPYEPRT